MTGPTVSIEIEFFKGMGGASGEDILKSKVLQSLPDESHIMPLDEVLSKLRLLQQSSLCKFTGASAQGIVATLCSLVEDLLQGRASRFAANPDSFAVLVKARLAFCCTATKSGKAITGSEAATCLCEALQKKQTNPTIEDLELPIKFSRLVSADLAKKVEEIRVATLATATKSVASIATMPHDKKKGRPTDGEGGSSSSASGSFGPLPQKGSDCFGGRDGHVSWLRLTSCARSSEPIVVQSC